MKSLTRAMVFLVVASLLLAGMVTGSYAEEPKVLHMSQNAEMDTLDTGNTGLSATIDMMNLMMDCLFRLDENNVPQPNVCESYTVSDDGLTYTFTLRDSTWSNGTPVTAADFEYAWKRTCDPANGFENAFLFNYIPMKNLAEINAGTADISTLGVTAKDDKTLVVELTTPCNWLVEYLCACFFAPLNQEFVESCGDQYALSSDNLLTNGPFKLENWTAGDLTWTLTKNPDHPDADKIYFDAVEYQVIKDNQTAIMAFESGTVDFVTISSDQVALYEGSEAFLSAPSTTSCYIVPNFEDPTLQNQNLLYAIGFSIDRDSLTQNILADGSVAKYDCNYTDCFFGPDGTEFNSARPDFWACDKAKALEYWEAAKEELGVETLELELTCDDAESHQNVAAFIQSEIETTCPGLIINLRVVPMNQRLDDMTNGNFQLAIHRTGSSVPNIVAKLGQYTTGHALNYGKYSNAEYDALYNETLASSDEETIWNNSLDLEEMAQKSAVAIPVYRGATCQLVRPGLTGYYHHLIGVSFDFRDARFED